MRATHKFRAICRADQCNTPTRKAAGMTKQARRNWRATRQDRAAHPHTTGQQPRSEIPSIPDQATKLAAAQAAVKHKKHQREGTINP